MPGPLPKRSEERRRRNKPSTVPMDGAVADIEPTKVPGTPGVEWPQPDPAWHPIVADLYRSLQRSGQARFYEPSDVAYIILTAECTNRLLSGAGTRSGTAGLSGQTLSAVDSMWSKCLVTEADRRRLRIELEKGVPEEAPSVGIMAEYRKKLRVVNG